MNRQKQHLQGRRGQAFLQLVRGVPREQILVVSIDVHKYYHLVLIHNGQGEALTPSFQIDIFRSGFESLCAQIDRQLGETQAQVLFIGMEPTGHYFENLARHLRDRYRDVRLVNSFAVARNRDQKMMRRTKTDEIDVTAIGDLLLRNECFPYEPLGDDYLRLQYWVRYRNSKTKARTALKNQIIGHLDRIFPGLARPNQEGLGDHPPLFSDLWDTQRARRFLELGPNPRELAEMEPAELIDRFHARGWPMGPVTARRIIEFAQQVLLPDPDVIEARLPLLKADLALLRAVEDTLAVADEQIASHLAKTRGQILTEIKGVGVLRAAAYVAGIGNPEHYENAGQTFRRSGLVSGRNDSGIHQRRGRGQRVTKEGDSHLRRALVEMAHGMCQWQPYFGAYKTRLERHGKPPGVAAVATARKLNGVLFALMRDQAPFEPLDAHGRPVPPAPGLKKQKATADRDPI
jgi:transposase